MGDVRGAGGLRIQMQRPKFYHAPSPQFLNLWVCICSPKCHKIFINTLIKIYHVDNDIISYYLISIKTRHFTSQNCDETPDGKSFLLIKLKGYNKPRQHIFLLHEWHEDVSCYCRPQNHSYRNNLEYVCLAGKSVLLNGCFMWFKHGVYSEI